MHSAFKTATPLVAALALMLLPACGSPFSDAPPVPDSTFVEVMAELHLAEARLQVLHSSAPPDSLAVPISTRDSILARYRMTPQQLQAALRYYAEHPKQYVEVYDRLLDRFNAERDFYRRHAQEPDGPR